MVELIILVWSETVFGCNNFTAVLLECLNHAFSLCDCLLFHYSLICDSLFFFSLVRALYYAQSTFTAIFNSFLLSVCVMLAETLDFLSNWSVLTFYQSPMLRSQALYLAYPCTDFNFYPYTHNHAVIRPRHKILVTANYVMIINSCDTA